MQQRSILDVETPSIDLIKNIVDELIESLVYSIHRANYHKMITSFYQPEKESGPHLIATDDRLTAFSGCRRLIDIDSSQYIFIAQLARKAIKLISVLLKNQAVDDENKNQFRGMREKLKRIHAKTIYAMKLYLLLNELDENNGSNDENRHKGLLYFFITQLKASSDQDEITISPAAFDYNPGLGQIKSMRRQFESYIADHEKTQYVDESKVDRRSTSLVLSDDLTMGLPFKHLYDQLVMVMKSNKNLKLDNLSENNLSYLKVLCDMNDAVKENKYFSFSEVEASVRIQSNRLAIKNKKTRDISIESIKDLQNDLSYIEACSRCRKVIDELSGDGPENMFQKLRNLMPKDTLAINSIEAKWVAMKPMAYLSSHDLNIVKKRLLEMTVFIQDVNNELKENESIVSKFTNLMLFSTHFSDGLNQIKMLLHHLDKMIKQQFHDLIQAMLARLDLVPKSHLALRQTNAQYSDDVVLSTLKLLAMYGLSGQYLKILEKRHRHPFTHEMVLDFMAFIEKFGDEKQIGKMDELIMMSNQAIHQGYSGQHLSL